MSAELYRNSPPLIVVVEPEVVYIAPPFVLAVLVEKFVSVIVSFPVLYIAPPDLSVELFLKIDFNIVSIPFVFFITVPSLALWKFINLK